MFITREVDSLSAPYLSDPFGDKSDKRKKIWLDSLSCSFFYKSLLEKKNKIVQKTDPIHFLKSIKNNTEIKNMKKSHLKDGVALTKFLFWLKKNFKKKKITEISNA